MTRGAFKIFAMMLQWPYILCDCGHASGTEQAKFDGLCLSGVAPYRLDDNALVAINGFVSLFRLYLWDVTIP